MTCLYHGDYGPPDPAFAVPGLRANAHAWSIDPARLVGAQNLDEALAIERHLLRGHPVQWCDQGYAWTEQPAVHWLLIAALVFVVVPYATLRIVRAVGWNRPRRVRRATPFDAL